MAVATFHMINNDAGAQTLKTRPGDVFTLGAYAWPKAGNTGGGTIKLVLHCTSTVASPPAPVDVVAYTGTVPATGAWAYLTGTAIVPAGYDTVDPQITLTSVPLTDNIYFDDILVRETTAAQNVLDTVYNAITGGSGSANPLASLATSVSNWISTLFGTTSVQSTIAPGAVPNISATKITSGSFAMSIVTGLTPFYNAITGAGTAGSTVPDLQTLIDSLNTAVGGTGSNKPVTSWLTNLQTWMTNLWGTTNMGATPVVAVGAIPNLSATKITSGTFAQTMVTGLSSFYNALTGAGTAGSAMPDLQTMIDNLNTAVGGSGSGKAVTTWLTNLQTWMTNLWGTTNMGATPTVATGAIPNLSATKITSGQIGTAILPTVIPSVNIPALSADFAANMVLAPDFESTTLWTGATGSQSTAQAHSGTHSWQLTGAG